MALRGSSDVLLARRHLVGSEFETPGAAAPGGGGSCARLGTEHL